EPASRPVTSVRSCHAVRPRPPPVPGTHIMALRPSSVPQRVVLLSLLASSLPHVPNPESDLVRTASPTVTRLLATGVTGPSFESAAASALVAELVDFAALCRLNYAASLVFYSSCPSSVGGELALGCDVLEDRRFELECLAVVAPHLASTLLCLEGHPDALDIPTPRTYTKAITGTYVDEVPPPGAKIVDGMWIFRVKRPLASPPAFKARYVVRGFSQREGVDFFQIFSPTPKMTILWVLLYIAAQRDYELLWRPVYGQRQAPHEWYDTLRTTLAALGFAPSTADPSLFLRTDTFSTAVLRSRITQDRARRTITLTQSHIVQQVLQRFDFSWSSPQTTPLSTGHSLSAPPSNDCEAEIYAGAMAAQELRWLTCLLTDLGEQPRSPPVLYVDNKTMIALCQDQRLEHRTKHIALRYFLMRELQQRGQLRLA
ncbi:unnamed protein product, partial [Closterium sp. NIES-53]